MCIACPSAANELIHLRICQPRCVFVTAYVSATTRPTTWMRWWGRDGIVRSVHSVCAPNKRLHSCALRRVFVDVPNGSVRTEMCLVILDSAQYTTFRSEWNQVPWLRSRTFSVWWVYVYLCVWHYSWVHFGNMSECRPRTGHGPSRSFVGKFMNLFASHTLLSMASTNCKKSAAIVHTTNGQTSAFARQQQEKRPYRETNTFWACFIFILGSCLRWCRQLAKRRCTRSHTLRRSYAQSCHELGLRICSYGARLFYIN